MSGDKEPYRNENSTAHWGPTGSLNTGSFGGEVWIELVLKPQTNRREDPWQELMVSGLLLPGGSCVTTQLCFYQRWLDSCLKEHCHPKSSPLQAAPGIWNPTKPTNLSKHHQTVLCATLPPCGHVGRRAASGYSARFLGRLKGWHSRLQRRCHFSGTGRDSTPQSRRARKANLSRPPAYSHLLFAISQHPASGELTLLHTLVPWSGCSGPPEIQVRQEEPEGWALLPEEQLWPTTYWKAETSLCLQRSI